MKIKTDKSETLSNKAKFKVPFGTVSITDDAQELINKAIETKWVTRGKYVQEFEERFAKLFDVKEAVALSSGTDADALACAVLYDFGAQRGDEIIVPALSFVATGNAVLQAGYIKRLAHELLVPEQALVAELKKVRHMSGEKKTFGKSVDPKTPIPEQLRVVESDILRLLLEEESFIDATRKEIQPSDFQDRKIREVISKIFDLCDQGKEVNSAILINSFEDQEMKHMITRIMA